MSNILSSTCCRLSEGKRITAANHTKHRTDATVAMVTVTMTLLVWCDVIMSEAALSSFQQG